VRLSQNFKEINHNVKLTFLFSIIHNFGGSIWGGSVLSAYIFFFSSSNIILGWTSGVMGIAMTLSVLPSGYFADKFRRDIILKIASAIGAISLLILIFGKDLIAIFIGLGFWGIYQGFTGPSLEAILADSTISGNRSIIYSRLHLIRQLSASIGPFISVLLFLLLGDTWELSILKTVMLIGMLISLISIGIMFFFNDKRTLGDKSESISDENTNGTLKNNSDYKKRNWIIFGTLIASMLIIGIGAGMTLKYFSIFFIETYALKPISVELIMGTTTIVTGIAGIIAQRLSRSKGRIRMIFWLEVIGTVCLFIIALYPTLWLLIPIFLIRGSFMNAGEPLNRSILMDIVPKKHRAKVNSIQTIAWGLFWNFSAVIGGYLIGDIRPYNFRLNFIVTACIYIIGVIPLILLFPLVKEEDKKKK